MGKDGLLVLLCYPDNTIVFDYVDLPLLRGVRINLVFTPRSLSVGIELFAAVALVVWIATGCVLVAIYGAPP